MNEREGGRRVLLATRSAGKRRELGPMLRAHGWAPIDLAEAGIVEDASVEDALEQAATFEENALSKARHFHRLSGLPTIADDSGLSCDALDGAPGVRSKRWSERADLSGLALDDANNALLQQALAAAARAGRASRAARYVCAAAYVDAARAVVARGETTGRILEAADGTEGFGYDPYFFSDELQQPFGRVTREAKGRVSHRGRAVSALLERLASGS
jgi:XTP/dITP diphosphohydrolase